MKLQAERLMTPLRGFILQPTYRIEGGRPVVQLYGKLEGGGNFLVRDDRSVPSFVIETDPKARRLLAISLYGCGAAEVLLLTPPGYSCPEGAVIPCATEGELLLRFQQRVRELDPDILTGWNVIDFDLTVL